MTISITNAGGERQDVASVGEAINVCSRFSKTGGFSVSVDGTTLDTTELAQHVATMNAQSTAAQGFTDAGRWLASHWSRPLGRADSFFPY